MVTAFFRFTKSHIILMLLPFILGGVCFKYLSNSFLKDENELIRNKVQAYELSGNLIAEKIQGDITNVDLLLLLLQSKAQSTDLSNQDEMKNFFRYIKTRARFYTPLDNLSIFNASGELLFTAETTRTDYVNKLFDNLKIIHTEKLLPFSITKAIYRDSEEIVLSRIFYHNELNTDLIVVGELGKRSIMMNFDIDNSVVIDEAVLFDGSGKVYFALENTGIEDLYPLLGIYPAELDSLGGIGIHGGTNNIVKKNKIITVVQMKKFSLFLGIKSDLGSELTNLYDRKTMALTLVSLGSFLLFIIVFFVNRNELVKTYERQKAYSRLEELVDIRTQELQAAVDENIKLAATDSLTGLLNRRSMTTYLTEEINRAQRYDDLFSLVMCDIDHFKRINDTMGHEMGDNALKYIVGYLTDHFRKTDIISRWGGEEFLILLYKTDNSTAYNITEKIRSLIQDNPWLREMPITCSFGVTTYIEGDSIQSIIKRADDALYKAKITRNKVINHVVE